MPYRRCSGSSKPTLFSAGKRVTFYIMRGSSNLPRAYFAHAIHAILSYDAACLHRRCNLHELHISLLESHSIITPPSTTQTTLPYTFFLTSLPFALDAEKKVLRRMLIYYYVLRYALRKPGAKRSSERLVPYEISETTN